ncbi:MAG: amidohydrolase family protein [Phycisphaerales bacterium]|nr:amidohydrolase family protein [Phycisphaerales bacterium]
MSTHRCDRAHLWRRIGCRFITLTVGVVTLIASADAQDPVAVTRIIIADAFVAPDGTLTQGAVLRMAGAQIAALDSDTDGVRPDQVQIPIDRFPAGAVLSPGLIDGHAALALLGGRAELHSAVQPALRASDAFNQHTSQLAAALRGGITTVALAPDDQNLIAGRFAIVRTGGVSGPHLLRGAGPYKFSLAPAVFRVDREPTSRLGAVGLLRDTLTEAAKEPATGALADLLAGRAPAFAIAPTANDVLTLTQLSAAHSFRLVLIHQEEARDAAELAAGIAGVLVGPLAEAGPRAAGAAAHFERAGVPVALTADLPRAAPDALRLAAAQAARYGLTPAAARRAITATPATLLGIADRVGALVPGRDADLVVFSGDPLDLRSRVLAVYVEGQRVYTAPPAAEHAVTPR